MKSLRLPCLLIAATALLGPGCGYASSPLHADSPQKATPPAASRKPAQPEDALTRMETTILTRLNALRKQKGLEPLQADPRLGRIARDYSRQMAQQHFFRHTDPAGRTVADRVRAAGLSYRMVGENLYYSVNARDPADSAVKGWMQSPGHRENILRPEFTHTGVGVWRVKNRVWATQVFMLPG